MTEDPVKLYVIVMAILLCVLSYVAIDSWKQANAYAAALDRAPDEAEKMRLLAADVKALVDQLARSGLREKGFERILVERMLKKHDVNQSGFSTDPAKLGAGIRGTERRVKIDFGGTRASPPLTRDKVVRLCESVERESNGIVKTIEIKLSRATGDGAAAAGTAEQVVGERYKGTLIFVSHDRQFVSSLATQIVELTGDGKYNYYVGGYEEYLSSQGLE